MKADLDGLFIRSSNNAKVPGTYILLIELTEANPINVGKLGIHIFEPGYYLYTGSALNGLVSRISRHMRPDKPCHWHIDYLTQVARVIGIFWSVGTEKHECGWSSQISSSKTSISPVRGFGSSDCKCGTHLYFFSHLSNVHRMINQITPEYSVSSQ